MSQIPHGYSAQLQFVVAATETPKVLRHCSCCKAERSFTCGGKFRVNAQKKLIDVWLIYRCDECDQTWNCPIYERISVRAIAADVLNALMQNDPAMVAHCANDTTRLAALGARASLGQAADLRSVLMIPATAETLEIVLNIRVVSPTALRLDRVLAMGLALRCSDILTLAACDALTIGGATLKALKRSVRDRQIVRVNLTRAPSHLAEKCRRAVACCGAEG